MNGVNENVIAAVRRAVEKTNAAKEGPIVKLLAVIAAHEALNPIQELHKRTYLNDNPYEPAHWDCGECESPWPCATARLVYPSEELAQ